MSAKLKADDAASPLSEPFRQHLRTAAFDHPFARAFAGDALGDASFPEPANWVALVAYLNECGACPGAIEGAKIAWRDFSKERGDV